MEFGQDDHQGQNAESQGLPPTQGQILALLHANPEQGIRLSAVAKGLATSAATASDAVSSLVKKGRRVTNVLTIAS